MRLLWTADKTLTSKLIRWGLNESASHFAIELDGLIVFHSNIIGTTVTWAWWFHKNHEVVFSYDYHLSLEQEEAVYQQIIKSFRKPRWYDFGAFFYFAWRVFLWKIFGFSFPENNPWGERRSFICTEIAYVLPEWIVPTKKLNMDLGITSPYSLYEAVIPPEKDNT